MNEREKLASNSARCTIRQPRPADFKRMAELAGQLGYPCTDTQVRERIEEMRNSPEHAVFVAALTGDRVAGWVGCFVFRAVELDKCAEISGLIVDEEMRSQGVGAALLEAAEQWARSIGCGAISVHTNITRERAHGFYMGNGYRWVKTQEFLRKTLSA